MSLTISKARQVFGIAGETNEFSTSTFVKPFAGAFSMGTSKRAPLFNVDPSLPGPGAYQSTYRKKELPSYGFAKSERKTFTTSNVPSPGTYNLASSIGKGAPTYSIARKPQNKYDNGVVGPGSYDPRPPVDQSFGFSFGYKVDPNPEKGVPGPGTYHNELEENANNKKKNGVGTSSKFLPPPVKKRSAVFHHGFSISERDDFVSKEPYKVPGPGYYSPKFSAHQPYGPSYKFVTDEKSFRSSKLDETNPGPGHFDIKEKLIKPNNPSFTIYGKYSDPSFPPCKDIPGPGAYNPQQLTKPRFTKFKTSSKAIEYSSPTPGPGTYSPPPPPEKSIKFPESIRDPLQTLYMEPGPGHYDLSRTEENRGAKMLGKFDLFRPTYMDSPGPGQYSTELKQKVKLGKIGGTGKGGSEGKEWIPGPGRYQVEGSSLVNAVNANGPKYTFGQSYKQTSWKRLFDPGPGSYDIPSTIAGIPSYLNQNASRSHADESRFSNYIKEVNEKIEQTENF